MKKIISLILSVLLLNSIAISNVFAESSAEPNTVPCVETRYNYFSMVFASLYRTDSGFYHVEGGAGCYDSQKRLEITVTIEGCGSDGQYRPVDGFKWTASGYSVAATQGTRDLAGGAYRAHTIAKCYQNNTLLETVEAYSNIVNVPF